MNTTPTSRSTSKRPVAGLLGLCVLGLGFFMGGCNDAMKDENAALQQEAAQLRDQNAMLKASNDQMQEELSRGGARAGGGYDSPVRTRNTSHETVIEIAGDVLFDSGQATLKSTAKKELDKLVANIRSRHPGRLVRIEGYTDSDPIRKSKWPSNEALSQARADAVKEYLVSKGISSGSVTTIGMGAAKPKATKPASRRVEVVIVETGG